MAGLSIGYLVIVGLAFNQTHYSFANPCPVNCDCTTIETQSNLLDVRCMSAFVPGDLPEKTGALTLYGLNNLSHPYANQSIKYLQNLTIDGGTFTYMGETSFTGFEHVSRLAVRNAESLREIDKMSFSKLRNLESIEFNMIPFNISTMSRFLSSVNNKKLREITYRCQGPAMMYAEVLDEKIYRSFKHLNITHLTITLCSIAVVRTGFTQYFPNILYINMSHNYISGDKMALLEITSLRKLVVLDLSFQHNDNLQKRTSQGQKSLQSTGTFSNFRRKCFALPPPLTSFYMHYSNAFLYWFSACINSNNSLKRLDFAGNILQSFSAPMVGFHSLIYFNIRSIELQYFPHDMFNQVPLLETIMLGHNPIYDIIENDNNGNIFRNNNHLTTLDLSYCSIKTLPGAFMYSIRGIENLHLEGNDLETLDITPLHRLKILNISSNNFDTLSDDFVKSLNRIATTSHLTIDLGNNPISLMRVCCDILNLIRLFMKGNINLFGSDKYSCIFNNQVKHFEHISMTQLDTVCQNKSLNIEIIFFIITASVLIGSITLSVVVYRKRWCIKTYILAGKRYLKRNQERCARGKFTFDAFVCYHETNSSWVREVLFYHMETVQKLRLCLHERDFIPGIPIAENISNAIDSSQRVILIISEAFTKSHWCLLEMQIARQTALERGSDVIIPIILQRINDSEGNRTLFSILRQNTYLEWPQDDTEGQAFFLQRLSEAVKSNVDDLVP